MTDLPTLDFAHLLDWLEGRLPADQAQAVTQQLAHADQDTLATLAWLRSFQQTSQALVIETPPATLRSTLIEHFAATRRQPGILRRMVALLSFDSSQQTALLGARGSNDAKRRQLVFSTELADIAINIMPRAADQQLELSGQIFKKDNSLSEPLLVKLFQDDALLDSTLIDEYGEFVFPAVTPAHYSITISDAATVLVCEPLSLDSR